MNNEKIMPLIRGAITLLPGVKKLFYKHTGGTINSRYCYSVWLRHLIKLNNVGCQIPSTIAELGPGDSLGIGLAALLSGCRSYYALDVIKYWDTQRNLQIFEELIILFKNRSPIPDNVEFSKVIPEIENYDFPFEIITNDQLNYSLSEERLDSIRKEICNMESSTNSFIFYHIPWYDSKIIGNSSVDFIYSQAVLEHVDDLENTYSSMNKWLKSSGLMSHSIDFCSHRITKSWNGHWTFSDFEWNIIRGGRIYTLNRQPFSKHIDLHERYGFEILEKNLVKSDNQLKQNQIAKRFKHLNELELTTSGMYILSKKI
jgi:SAM-dependent methyltransferase